MPVVIEEVPREESDREIMERSLEDIHRRLDEYEEELAASYAESYARDPAP